MNITASTAEGRPATTVLASPGTPTAQHERQQLLSFRGNSQKSRQNGEKLVKKTLKVFFKSSFFVLSISAFPIAIELSEVQFS
jgi:hypothetical protein